MRGRAPFRGSRSRTPATMSCCMGRRRSMASPFSPKIRSRRRPSACRASTHEGQSRYIEAVVSDGSGGAVRVASIYAPNGNPPDTPKYAYKLAFMAALSAHAQALLAARGADRAGGRLQCHPGGRATFTTRPSGPATRCFFRKRRAALRRADSIWATRTRCAPTTDAAGLYTFWDYQAGAWQKNKGIRIDHLLLSPQAADRLKRVEIGKDVRAGEKPSDHVPIYAEIA